MYEVKAENSSVNPAELLRTARTAQDVLLSIAGLSGDDDLDEELEAITEAEIHAGWLRGPFTREELDKKFGQWIPARRFAVRQGQKVRAIDDFSLLGQNDATGIHERVDLTGVDLVAGAARAFMGAKSEDDTAAGLFLETASGTADHSTQTLRGRRLQP